MRIGSDVTCQIGKTEGPRSRTFVDLGAAMGDLGLGVAFAMQMKSAWAIAIAVNESLLSIEAFAAVRSFLRYSFSSREGTAKEQQHEQRATSEEKSSGSQRRGGGREVTWYGRGG